MYGYKNSPDNKQNLAFISNEYNHSYLKTSICCLCMKIRRDTSIVYGLSQKHLSLN